MKDKKLADFLSFNTATGLRNFGLETKEIDYGYTDQ